VANFTGIRTHFREWVTLVNKMDDPIIVAGQIENLMKLNYSIHFHVWDESSFRTFVDEAKSYLGNSFDVSLLIRNGSEIIAVLQKC